MCMREARRYVRTYLRVQVLQYLLEERWAKTTTQHKHTESRKIHKVQVIQTPRFIMTVETTTTPAVMESPTKRAKVEETAVVAKEVATEDQYWSSFYAQFDISVPSQFCCMVATEVDKTMPVVEFGCGNGRDSIYLARQGFQVFASDLCATAVKRNNEKEAHAKNSSHTSHAEFSVCDVSNADHVTQLVESARSNAAEGRLTFYNRFFLHTLTDDQELVFLTALAKAAQKGDKLYMEFRCSLDAELDKAHGKGHFRRYVETDTKLAPLLKELGFAIQYNITGQGMAKYKTEDSFVSRITAEKQ